MRGLLSLAQLRACSTWYERNSEDRNLHAETSSGDCVVIFEQLGLTL